MRLTIRGKNWDEPPRWRDVGIHVEHWTVALNIQAEGSYLSLEGPHGVLYRLNREGLRISRAPVSGGTLERAKDGTREALWWHLSDLGHGTYQAIVPPMVVYLAIDDDGRCWWVSDDPGEAADDLLGDYPRDDETGGFLDFPDGTIIAQMASDIPVAIDAEEAPQSATPDR